MDVTVTTESRHHLAIDNWMVAHIFGEDGEVTRQIESHHSVRVQIEEDIPGLPCAILVISGQEEALVSKAFQEIQQRVRGLVPVN